jgi:hypothetical protein
MSSSTSERVFRDAHRSPIAAARSKSGRRRK